MGASMTPKGVIVVGDRGYIGGYRMIQGIQFPKFRGTRKEMIGDIHRGFTVWGLGCEVQASVHPCG